MIKNENFVFKINWLFYEWIHLLTGNTSTIDSIHTKVEL